MLIFSIRLKEVLHYNPSTGMFKWKVRLSNRAPRIGQLAGVLGNHGYLQIQIDSKIYLAHRLAWLYVHGVWPKYDIDHKDHNKQNNRIKNLRDVTTAGNMQNTLKAFRHSTTKVLNVYRDKRSKSERYIVKLVVNKKQIQIGKFLTLKEAQESALKAKRELHTTCTI